ncbi:UNVERIFIED_CONTAM: transmembrane protein, putative [Hammondia hammondi]|eukprot:XP_008882351.1 transmembrane protein, putative [Hammondia hammondi]
MKHDASSLLLLFLVLLCLTLLPLALLLALVHCLLLVLLHACLRLLLSQKPQRRTGFGGEQFAVESHQWLRRCLRPPTRGGPAPRAPARRRGGGEGVRQTGEEKAATEKASETANEKGQEGGGGEELERREARVKPRKNEKVEEEKQSDTEKEEQTKAENEESDRRKKGEEGESLGALLSIDARALRLGRRATLVRLPRRATCEGSQSRKGRGDRRLLGMREAEPAL